MKRLLSLALALAMAAGIAVFAAAEDPPTDQTPYNLRFDRERNDGTGRLMLKYDVGTKTGISETGNPMKYTVSKDSEWKRDDDGDIHHIDNGHDVLGILTKGREDYTEGAYTIKVTSHSDGDRNNQLGEPSDDSPPINVTIGGAAPTVTKAVYYDGGVTIYGTFEAGKDYIVSKRSTGGVVERLQTFAIGSHSTTATALTFGGGTNFIGGDVVIREATAKIETDKSVTVKISNPTDPIPITAGSGCSVEYYAGSMANRIGEPVPIVMYEVGKRLTPADMSNSGLGSDWLNLKKDEIPGDGNYGVALVSYPTISDEPSKNVVKVLYMLTNN